MGSSPAAPTKLSKITRGNMKILKLLGAIVMCEIIGGLGAIATTPNIDSWYSTLNKPFFSPPNYLFAPVWTILYALMGIALYLIWTSEKKDKKAAYTMFFIQLVLNLIWSFIFFGYKLLFPAFIEIILMWVFILLTIIKFKKISTTAAWLLFPYILWVSFASVLNFAIWWVN